MKELKYVTKTCCSVVVTEYGLDHVKRGHNDYKSPVEFDQSAYIV